MLTFSVVAEGTRVKSDGKVTGIIRKTESGFAYYPSNTSRHGEFMEYEWQVRNSLAMENEPLLQAGKQGDNV